MLSLRIVCAKYEELKSSKHISNTPASSSFEFDDGLDDAGLLFALNQAEAMGEDQILPSLPIAVSDSISEPF